MFLAVVDGSGYLCTVFDTWGCEQCNMTVPSKTIRDGAKIQTRPYVCDGGWVKKNVKRTESPDTYLNTHLKLSLLHAAVKKCVSVPNYTNFCENQSELVLGGPLWEFCVACVDISGFFWFQVHHLSRLVVWWCFTFFLERKRTWNFRRVFQNVRGCWLAEHCTSD